MSSSSINEETLVVEIGPGLGSLTEILLSRGKAVLAYEIDKDLIPILEETFVGKPLYLLNADILKRDIDEDIKSLNIEFSQVIVVANLPYYITTPIILKVLEESNIINELVVMMQLEVANRLTSKPSTKDYNSLSVVIQYKTTAKIALKVPRTVFVPAPNVDSAVVKLVVKEKREETPDNEKVFYKLVRSSFTQRRKTLVNNLSSQFGKPKQEIIDILETNGFRKDIRAEKLSVLDFIQLSNNFTEEIL